MYKIIKKDIFLHKLINFYMKLFKTKKIKDKYLESFSKSKVYKSKMLDRQLKKLEILFEKYYNKL